MVGIFGRLLMTVFRASDEHRPTSPARTLADAALIEAMRRGDEGALREFLVRFEPLLEHHAHRLGASGEERDDLVGETLEDTALALLAPNGTTPRSVPAYLVKALRNRIFNTQRAVRGVLRVRESAGRGAANADDALCSESSQRASAGPAWEPPRPSRAVAALASALFDDLGDGDRLLLVWVSHHVPYREIASWLGIRYAAVGKRVERLRTRLRARADLHLVSCSDAERRVLSTLFSRASPLAARMPPSRADAAAARAHAHEGHRGSSSGSDQ